MCSLRSRYWLAGGVALLALAGCHSYAPTYPAYGTPTYPPVYSPGPTLGAPTTLPPGGGTIIQSPGTLSPGGPTLSPTTPGGQPYPTPVQPTPATPGGDSWPTPSGSPPFQGGSQPGQNLVPNYGDPNELPPFESTRNTSPSRSATMPTGTQTGGVPAGAEPFENDSPFKEDFQRDGGAAQLNGSDAAGGPMFADAQMPVESPANAQTIQTVSATQAAEPPTAPRAQANPFDYDRKGHRWLRGIVDQNLQDHTWHIRYSRDPDGTVQLSAPAEKFAEIQPGDVVLVEGAVEPDGRRYRVDRLFGPLVLK